MKSALIFLTVGCVALAIVICRPSPNQGSGFQTILTAGGLFLTILGTLVVHNALREED